MKVSQIDDARNHVYSSFHIKYSLLVSAICLRYSGVWTYHYPGHLVETRSSNSGGKVKGAFRIATPSLHQMSLVVSVSVHTPSYIGLCCCLMILSLTHSLTHYRPRPWMWCRTQDQRQVPSRCWRTHRLGRRQCWLISMTPRRCMKTS